jgi:hypothetical protein
MPMCCPSTLLDTLGPSSATQASIRVTYKHPLDCMAWGGVNRLLWPRVWGKCDQSMNQCPHPTRAHVRPQFSMNGLHVPPPTCWRIHGWYRAGLCLPCHGMHIWLPKRVPAGCKICYLAPLKTVGPRYSRPDLPATAALGAGLGLQSVSAPQLEARVVFQRFEN